MKNTMEIKNNTKRKTDIYTLVSSNSIKAVSQMTKIYFKEGFKSKVVGPVLQRLTFSD